MGYFLQGGLKLGGFSNRGLLDARSSSYGPCLTRPSLPSPSPRSKTPIGPVAQQTAKDAADARTKTTFDPAEIEKVIRNGRIDNETRHEVIDGMRNDPVVSNLTKRLARMNWEQIQQAAHFACRRILNLAKEHGWSTLEIVEAMLSLDPQSPITI
ncbi:hypothetical protein A4X06_0g9036, partial [Tilletia controversa]